MAMSATRLRSAAWLPWLLVVFTTSLVGCGGGGGNGAAPNPPPAPPPPVLGTGPAACVNGRADGYACGGLRLRKHVGLAALGATAANDVWGWVDPGDGTEYAIVGLSNGTGFVRLADPDNPAVVGRLPTATVSSAWRDVKVAQNHAYIVADNVGNHGMQVFDLTRLRGAGPNVVFAADVDYGDFGSAHNIAINEASNFAYAVGSDTCGGGLHMIDIGIANNPTFAGCHGTDGDTHDAQCVDYTGPDADHVGKEICFNSNENHVVIVDVTNKGAPVTLASFVYPNLGFVHQNWLTEDQRFMFLGDELDEQQRGFNTRTLVFDVQNLDAPVFLYGHSGPTPAVDHNMYVRGKLLYQANYTAGLRVLEFGNLGTDTLTEVAYFDTRPEDDSASFNGAWSVYPFFPSGVVAISDIQRGLFLVSP